MYYMETVSLRLDPALARRIEKEMASAGYSTKTEFIREAIRNRLSEIEERRKAEWERLAAMRGILKGKGKAKTDEEFRKIRIEAAEKYINELEKKFELNQK
ncbi:MAG: ribbon-helix-helix protein, CopG family [Candidatus Diapherotrites archaeon]|nr:ribbon-helix-helix protein, CopG family [Candidatus Diapherotrites archaeon]